MTLAVGLCSNVGGTPGARSHSCNPLYCPPLTSINSAYGVIGPNVVYSPSVQTPNGFCVLLQSSLKSYTVTGEVHGSHTSPMPSRSESAWFGLGVVGQLSRESGTPSPSLSVSPGHWCAGGSWH